MTKHVFFTDALGSGGISTNVVALASHVGTLGKIPIIVPLSSIKHGVGVWENCSKISKLFTVWNLIYFIFSSTKDEFIFFTTSSRTLIVAYFIYFFSILKGHKLKIVFCTYHPSEFSASGYWCDIYRLLVCTLGPENIFFMNGACYFEHEAICKKGTVKLNIMPLAIPNSSGVEADLIDVKSKSILTVGRFVGFKLHYMRALLQYAIIRPEHKFYFVGDGDGGAELKEFVISNNLINVIFLGHVDYEKLNSIYKQATCYVGMGTTLVEAAAAGTPCVVAIVGISGDLCYGLFTNQTECDMGEYRPTKIRFSMSGCLDSVLALNELELNNLGLCHSTFASQFSSTSVGALYCDLSKCAKYTRLCIKNSIIFAAFLLATFAYKLNLQFFNMKSRYDKSHII